MIKYFSVLSFILFSSVVLCQEKQTDHKTKFPVQEHAFGDFSISASPGLLINTPNGVQAAGGLKINAYVCKWLSFDADAVIGWDYFHAGPGILGIPLYLLMFRSEGLVEEIEFPDFLIAAVVILLSAEHISGHIPVKDVLDISPYLSLIRYKYAWEHYSEMNAAYAGSQLSYAVGVQLYKYFNRFYLSPYAEVNVGYNDHIPGYNIGIYCGYYFYGK